MSSDSGIVLLSHVSMTKKI